MYLEDYEVGKEYFIEPHEVNEEEMINFAKVYDNRPFHIDEEGGKESRFNKIFASGFFTLVFTWSKWVNTKIDSEGVIAGIGLDNLRWHKPVFAGDVLKSKVKILEVSPSQDKPVGSVRLYFESTNQNDEKVISLEAIYLVSKKIK
ncbi:MaoC family dehydratase N-terminal domain-containing protein [Peptoniphilus sp. MSJ-1]|uniref:MaoC family dehydratase N-terminal domain-containing protein n=1 Tax=Peptoniphilus ovalis TaxID=2841503 RepID=A0ABS6FFQ1_9FIRM|nr:MaoC/PaaZ C-terminal domain-containing protein [Peptoniphilus ovalis]MBU5668991.1 MaoC family dehydratase N-terminal domain-containing protein [Peptoniphilus ovalis]